MRPKLSTFLWSTLLSLLVVTAPAMAATETFRLTEFYNGDSTLRMQGKSAEMEMQIPLSGNLKVNEATLTLNTLSSVALLDERSVLSVRFNNATIAQIPYSSARPVNQARVVIPPSLWREGFNSLTFAVSQHYAEKCEAKNSPELWSEIDLYTSSLSINSGENIQSLSLSLLSEFFTPGIGGQRNVTLLSAQDADQSISTNVLPMVAQALALRNQYQPLKVAHMPLPALFEVPETLSESELWTDEYEQAFRESAWYLNKTSEALHVIVGTKDELASYGVKNAIESVDGAYLGIERLPAFTFDDTVIRPRQYRLIVSGDTIDDVKKAALALAIMDDALNADDSTVIDDISALSTERLFKSHVLSPGQTYTFEDMGVGSEVLRGGNSYAKRVSFMLPADFYVTESATVKLFLDFGYGAGLGLGSMMNVMVNGELIHGLNLDNPNGQTFRNYQLNLPARLLKGGANNIDFEVTMQAPLVGKPCAEITNNHLVFQMLNRSRVELPDAASVATQPDLNLFAETVFPFARYSSNEIAEIVFTEPEMYNSALTLVAKLAQVGRNPLMNLNVRQGSGNDIAGSAIILGTPERFAAIEQSEFASAIEKSNKWPYRLQNSLHNRVRKWADDESHKDMKVEGQTVQQNALGDLGVLMVQTNHQGDSTHTLMLIAAQSADMLNRRIDDLTSLTLWGQLAGDFFVWKDSERPELIMQVNDKFEVGEANDTVMTLRMWLTNNPWYWLGAFIALVLLVSFVSYILLKRRNKKTQESW